MNIQYLQEGRKKKFAILPYRDFVRLVEMATDEADYHKALKILNDHRDRILDYDVDLILESPIKKMRGKHEITQSELARRMKVDKSYISRLEKPGAKLSHATLVKAAKAFGCTVEDLE